MHGDRGGIPTLTQGSWQRIERFKHGSKVRLCPAVDCTVTRGQARVRELELELAAEQERRRAAEARVRELEQSRPSLATHCV